MADPAPTERPMPVGYRFHPTDQELVGHYLRHKLMADDPSIDETVPVIGVCEYEPQDLLARAASAVPATKFDDCQCYFFSPRHYKYSNGKQLKRTTSHGFWKVTGRDRRIIDRDTNNVIGTKKTLVFYEGRVPHARKTCWIIHEYHEEQLFHSQNTYVLCWLKKNDEKKRKKKIHQITNNERELILQDGNHENICMNSEEYCSLSTRSVIQLSSQFNEATDSMIQASSRLNEATDSMIQPSSQFNEATDSMIQAPSLFNEATDSMIQAPSLFNEATDSMIQASSQFNEATDSMIQPSSQFNEATDSMIQPVSQLNETTDSVIQPISQLSKATGSIIQSTFRANEVVIQPTFQANEAMNSVIHTPPEPNFAFEAVSDEGEFDVVSLWQLPPAPRLYKQGQFEIIATPYMYCHEA